jgi:hypothetical protein
MLAARPGSGGRMAHTDTSRSDLRGTSPADLERLERDLAASVDGEVRFDAAPAAPDPPRHASLSC